MLFPVKDSTYGMGASVDMKHHEIDVVILCGGKGSRLNPVLQDKPKALAPIGDKTFLDILLHHLFESGFRRFILCVGHLKDQIINHPFLVKNCSIIFSQEFLPLGTGGGVQNAQKHIKSNPFLVLNGDSICKVDFDKFINFHFISKSLVSIVVSSNQNKSDVGRVLLDSQSRIKNFTEKPKHPRGFLSNGIYLMRKNVFKLMPKKDAFSLELDFFPGLANQMCFGFVTENAALDIGTPQRYKQAIKIFA